MVAAISVVIPWHKDPSLLCRQLDLLKKQSDLLIHGEVVIVCNSSSTWEELEGTKFEFLRTPRQPLGATTLISVCETGVKSAAYARNAGWRLASGELILFCDADDEVDCSWVRKMANASASHPNALLGGVLRVGNINSYRRLLWEKDVSVLGTKFSHLPFVPSSNFAVPKKWLIELNGFDPELRVGEDIDICWRAQYLGASIHFVDDAFVDYRLRNGLCNLWKQSYDYGFGDAPLLRKHYAFGARRKARDTAIDLLSAVSSLVSSCFHRDFSKASQRIGNFSGRIVSSAVHRIWVV